MRVNHPSPDPQLVIWHALDAAAALVNEKVTTTVTTIKHTLTFGHKRPGEISEMTLTQRYSVVDQSEGGKR